MPLGGTSLNNNKKEFFEEDKFFVTILEGENTRALKRIK